MHIFILKLAATAVFGSVLVNPNAVAAPTTVRCTHGATVLYEAVDMAAGQVISGLPLGPGTKCRILQPLPKTYTLTFPDGHTETWPFKPLYVTKG